VPEDLGVARCGGWRKAVGTIKGRWLGQVTLRWALEKPPAVECGGLDLL